MKATRLLALALAWTFGGVGLVLGGLYAGMLLFNWGDASESDAARWMSSNIHEPDALSATGNAYLHALGFAAPPAVDPASAGRARLDWLLRLDRDPQRLLTERDPLTGEQWDARLISASAGLVVQVFDSFCWSERSSDQDCLDALMGRDREIFTWLMDSEWLIDRYDELLAHTQWLEPHGSMQLSTWTVLGPLAAGQRLWMVQAYALASAGEVDRVRDLLEQDLAFWRMVHQQTTTMNGRRQAAERLLDHFRWGAIALKRLPRGTPEAIPDAWRQPLTAPELSMANAMASEWRDAINWVEALAQGREPSRSPRSVQTRPLSERMVATLVRPFFKPQDFANRYARELRNVATMLDVPLGNYPQALAVARGYSISAWEGGLATRLYNPGGSSVLAMLTPVIEALVVNAAIAADVEGVRRARLLATEMRLAGVADAQSAVLLAPAELYDPYTDRPFQTDEATGAIVFEGLSRSGRRGGFRVWY